GPTASGKTALGIALAKKFGGEIVSADSRQIYRGMDIGTAKPTAAERRGVPHHLIDIKDPDEDYTVADYQRNAIAAINGIIARGKLPLLVGGTGLYIKSVLENLDIPKTQADPQLRAEIEDEIARDGIAAVFKKLVARDPEAAYVVDPKNPRRVVRALEVAISTGEPFTAQRVKREPLFDALILVLNPPPEILRERIDQRVDRMMRDGLVSETAALIKKYRAKDTRLPVAFDAIGYREIIAHLNGALSLEDAIAAVKMNTWHYAKRQMTWFKKTPEVHWIDDVEKALLLADHFLR
ncbi:MAG: tRNA (adenosine(37)-N6)-dimethylallyltransferase MiaA, partial [Minisyncoccia bacterium]